MRGAPSAMQRSGSPEQHLGYATATRIVLPRTPFLLTEHVSCCLSYTFHIQFA